MCGRPSGCKGVFERFVRAGSGASVCPACSCSHHHGCWPVWRSRIGSTPLLRARGAWTFHWLSRPRLLTVAPYLSTDLPCVPDASSLNGYTAASGALYDPPCAISAQTVLAILFASATVISMRGFRASMPANHAPALSGLRPATFVTELAPMMRSLRKLRSPIFVVRPRRSFPPLECCRGTRPSQAAKSRPRRKVLAAGASATSAVAITGPTPGIVISRLATGSAFARYLAVEQGDLRLQRFQPLCDHAQHGTRLSRDVGGGVTDDLDQLADVPDTLTHDVAELGEVSAQSVDQLGTLSTSRSRVRNTTADACASALLP